MPHDVIMPALGMAQDTGLIVAWLKQPGDAVKAGEGLMEVETDKATMEVEAQVDGFLSGVAAAAGEHVPIGQVVAVIADTEDAAVTVEPAAPEPQVEDARPAPSERAAPAETPREPTPQAAPVAAAGDGRILASPKARRLAREQGLDLGHLARSGARPPYHVADLEVLRAVPATAPAAAAATRIEAQAPRAQFDELLEFIAAETGAAAEPGRVFAAFAAAALREATGRETELRVGIETAGTTAPARLVDPDRISLAATCEAGPDGPADLIVRDLTGSAITAMRRDGENAVVIQIADAGAHLAIALEGALAATEAVALVNAFAGRISEPLRHLL
ncbi:MULTISPECIES: biotin/lipoyl-containing protein [unclassified Roseitalea]|uniref:biotin/lipoyl-containing protein n=1 Tax=unclassified Roseitalea TaxID=2639107 RepID=UPI00273D04C2|nr:MULTISPECIES: biotin/lipoyl-containing protein [unclassified Roseitalea]